MNYDLNNAVEDSTNRLAMRAVYALFGLAGAGTFGLIGWILTETIENRQFRNSGDRYTKVEASRDEREVFERINKLRDDLTRLQVTVERIERGM